MRSKVKVGEVKFEGKKAGLAGGILMQAEIVEDVAAVQTDYAGRNV